MPDSPDYIEQLINKLVGHPFDGVINHDVYEKKLRPAEPNSAGNWPCAPFSHRPRCVYFYYVRFDKDGALRVDHYFYPNGDPSHPSQWKPIDKHQIKGIITKLARNGRPHKNGKHPPRLRHHSFENIDWERISYIAIFVDETHWKLHKRSGPKARGAIAFNPLKGSLPNSSFFDAEDFEIEMSRRKDRTDKRTAICFINHMTTADGGGFKIDPEKKRKYVFDIYFNVDFAVPSTSPAILVLDPTGTNQGPPQRP